MVRRDRELRERNAVVVADRIAVDDAAEHAPRRRSTVALRKGGQQLGQRAVDLDIGLLEQAAEQACRVVDAIQLERHEPRRAQCLDVLGIDAGPVVRAAPGRGQVQAGDGDLDGAARDARVTTRRGEIGVAFRGAAAIAVAECEFGRLHARAAADICARAGLDGLRARLYNAGHEGIDSPAPRAQL